MQRLDGMVPPERILILTNVDQEAAVRALLPRFPAENIVAEPAKRDTAAAVALGAGWVAARDHLATMVVLPADHVIKDTAAFQSTLATAADAAQEAGALVTIGIKPTWACPGFGYIEQGKPWRDSVHHVVRFREKPNAELAESFVRKGNFRWNAGMFVWAVSTVLSEFNRHAPELANFIAQLSVPKMFDPTLQTKFAAFAEDFLRLRDHGKGGPRAHGGGCDSIGTTSAAGRRWRLISPTTTRATRPMAI